MRNARESGTAGLTRPHGTRPRAGTPSRPAARAIAPRGSFAFAASALALGGLLHAMPAQAIEFGDGELQGSLDTTISQGMTFRVEKRDEELTSDINGNDGNLNYDRGIVSNVSKFTTDLDVRSGGFGAFVRATGFMDFHNWNRERERTPLSDAAKERVGRDVELLDAYVTAAFDAGDAAFDLRFGKHVLNWGESTFIPNGINAVNPIDVSNLRRPGSELREALLPVGLASIAVAPTDTLSVEGFFQFDWEETEIDPVGTYFSSTDYVGPGAREAVITEVTANDGGFGFGPLTAAINADLVGYTISNPLGGAPIRAPQPLQPVFDADFASVLRGPDRTPEETGQWGLAMRYLAEELNHTEFGLYFINYHSRLPTIGARTGTRSGVQAGLAAAQAVGSPDSQTTRAVTAAVTQQVTQQVQAGLIPAARAPAAIEAQVSQRVTEIAAALAIDRYGKSGHYFVEYPEDVQLFGLSFNTQLGASGWALQGEYSFRRDAPLQKAERVVFEEGLRPIVKGLELGGVAAGAQAAAIKAGAAAAKAKGVVDAAVAAGQQPTPAAIDDAKKAGAAAEAAVAAAQAAGDAYGAFQRNYTPGTVKGYVERDASQVQATATKVFGPAMGAGGVVFVAEAALMRVHDMPDRNTEPLESPAGGTLATGKADADATSWGYRLAARLDYDNAIGAANLYPYAQFLHDVEGNSPAPSGPFVEGRTALTLGLRADYLSRWEADLSFTQYAGKGNELSDRDFISASIKYSF